MQLPFIICQLYKVLATHAIMYRKEEGHGLALILVETRLCCTISLDSRSVRPCTKTAGSSPCKKFFGGGGGGGGPKRVPQQK